MKQILFAILMVSTIILSGCITPAKNINEPNVGESCTTDSECNLPFEFAIQSNCPFETACIDSTCKIVCPIWFGHFDEEDDNLACTADSDCDCSDRREKTLDCVCEDYVCLSIEAE